MENETSSTMNDNVIVQDSNLEDKRECDSLTPVKDSEDAEPPENGIQQMDVEIDDKQKNPSEEESTFQDDIIQSLESLLKKCELDVVEVDINNSISEIHEDKEISSSPEKDCDEDQANVNEKGTSKLSVADEVKAHPVKDCILEPLTFPENTANASEEVELNESEPDVKDSASQSVTPCLLCDYEVDNIETKEQQDDYLCHIVVEHKLVIADVKLIADFRSYVLFWKKRFSEQPITDFCTIINTNTSEKDRHESEQYSLLCDELPEDRTLREKLQLERLNAMIVYQTEERNDKQLERMCLFCTKFFIGNRIDLFNHMNEDHNFNVGHPDNLINVEEFLNQIEKKLNELQCLFCEKVFKDRPSLREHMRKKSHRRLNPKNKIYDQYYIINYLELGKNWEILQGEPDQFENLTDDWSGWDEENQSAACFFCTSLFGNTDAVYGHMRECHDFDYPQMRKDMNLSFYQQVKMINFIRREIHQRKEEQKSEEYNNKEEMEIDEKERASQMAKDVIDAIRTSTKWNQPQYYFPTYENDSLLCQLEDKEGLFEPEDTFIIGEDGIDCKAIINESVLTDLVVRGYFD